MAYNLSKKKREIVSDLISKVKLHSAGEKMEKPGIMPCTSSSESDISYPSLYLTSVQSPELGGYEVGDEVRMVIQGKVTSHDLNERAGSSRETFNIKIEKRSNY